MFRLAEWADQAGLKGHLVAGGLRAGGDPMHAAEPAAGRAGHALHVLRAGGG